MATRDKTTTDPEPVGELLNSAMAAWVIHEVTVGGDGRAVWAWCRPDPTGDKAGYTEIVCTRDDGVTPVDFPANGRLGRVIAKLWC